MHSEQERFEAMSAREEAALARLEANRARKQPRMDRLKMPNFKPGVVREPREVCPRGRDIPERDRSRISVSFSPWEQAGAENKPRPLHFVAVVIPRDKALQLNCELPTALTNPVPACENPFIFRVSHFEICSYSEEAQRFRGDN